MSCLIGTRLHPYRWIVVVIVLQRTEEMGTEELRRASYDSKDSALITHL